MPTATETKATPMVWSQSKYIFPVADSRCYFAVVRDSLDTHKSTTDDRPLYYLPCRQGVYWKGTFLVTRWKMTLSKNTTWPNAHLWQTFQGWCPRRWSEMPLLFLRLRQPKVKMDYWIFFCHFVSKKVHHRFIATFIIHTCFENGENDRGMIVGR